MGFGGQAAPKLQPVPPPAPVMGGLNSLFQSLFGGQGGAGATAIGTLSDTAAGKAGSPGSATDVSKLFDSIKAASGRTQAEGAGRVAAQFAATGGGMSTDFMHQLASYNLDYGKNLDQTLADLEFKSTESAKQRQLSAAGILEETFGSAAMTYAPTAQWTGGATSGTGGSAALGAGASLLPLLFLSFL